MSLRTMKLGEVGAVVNGYSKDKRDILKLDFPTSVLINPPHAKVQLQPKDFELIKEAGIPLVGCKMAGGDKRWYKGMKEDASHLSVFIPGHRLATGISLGAHGAYSNIACLHPEIAQQWYGRMKLDLRCALVLQSRIQIFMSSCVLPYLTEKKYSNQAVDKFVATVDGWTTLSTRLRWPYDGIDEAGMKVIWTACQNLLPEFFNY